LGVVLNVELCSKGWEIEFRRVAAGIIYLAIGSDPIAYVYVGLDSGNGGVRGHGKGGKPAENLDFQTF